MNQDINSLQIAPSTPINSYKCSRDCVVMVMFDCNVGLYLRESGRANGSPLYSPFMTVLNACGHVSVMHSPVFPFAYKASGTENIAEIDEASELVVRDLAASSGCDSLTYRKMYRRIMIRGLKRDDVIYTADQTGAETTFASMYILSDFREGVEIVLEEDRVAVPQEVVPLCCLVLSASLDDGGTYPDLEDGTYTVDVLNVSDEVVASASVDTVGGTVQLLNSIVGVEGGCVDIDEVLHIAVVDGIVADPGGAVLTVLTVACA